MHIRLTMANSNGDFTSLEQVIGLNSGHTNPASLRDSFIERAEQTFGPILADHGFPRDKLSDLIRQILYTATFLSEGDRITYDLDADSGDQVPVLVEFETFEERLLHVTTGQSAMATPWRHERALQPGLSSTQSSTQSTGPATIAGRNCCLGKNSFLTKHPS